MAIYRHVLEIPPTAKVIPPYCITAEKIPQHFCFTTSSKKEPLTLDTAKRIPPTLNTAKRVLPTLDTAQKVPPTSDTAEKVPPILDAAHKVSCPLDTAQKVPAFRFVFVLCFFYLSGFSGSCSVEPLCGRVDRQTPRTCPYTCPHTCPHHAKRGPAEQ